MTAMNFGAICFFVFAAGAVAMLPGGAFAMTDEEAAAKGLAILQKNCSRCHAIGLTGSSPHPQAPPFRDVVQRYPIDNLAEALAEGIVSGHPDMPVFVFEPADIEAFLAYLDHLRGTGDEMAPGK